MSRIGSKPWLISGLIYANASNNNKISPFPLLLSLAFLALNAIYSLLRWELSKKTQNTRARGVSDSVSSAFSFDSVIQRSSERFCVLFCFQRHPAEGMSV